MVTVLQTGDQKEDADITTDIMIDKLKNGKDLEVKESRRIFMNYFVFGKV